jgi:hypothetical protein
MPAQARVGDIGVGYCHKHKREVLITFVTGASSTLSNNQPSCTVGTVGIADCGHTSIALTGSTNVKLDNKQAHRIGDTGVLSEGGDYVVVTGSPDILRG